MPMNKAQISRVLGKLIFLSEMREKERKAEDENVLSMDKETQRKAKEFGTAASRANN